MNKLWNAETFLNNVYIGEPDYLRAVKRDTYSNAALDNDLETIKHSWKRFQRSRDRDAVYGFLTEVFELVAWWTAEKKPISRAARILRGCGIAVPDEIEPFAVVVLAVAAPTSLDKRTISKWSRVLRYAAKCKGLAQPLDEFVKERGGLNECAAGYARQLGRRAK
jgi:hypothetical protein